MKILSDKELLEELKSRFDANDKAMKEQQRLMHQLEEVNKKLLDSESVKTQFLSNIRNEINNPLSSILGLAKTLINHPGDLDKVAYDSKLIHQEAFSLDFQLRNIFAAAELEAGETAPTISHVAISSLIAGVQSRFEHLLLKNELNTVVNGDEELNFHCDSDKLSLILSNLLSNAIEYNKQGGEIQISYSLTDDNWIEIKVQDTGIGIPEEHFETIFDRFRQLDIGVTKSHAGHGLGLTVTRSLVELLDGKLYLESKIDEGSTFTVTFPESTPGEIETFSDSGNVFFFEEEDDAEEETF